MKKMVKQQEELLNSILLTLSNVKTMPQVDSVWTILESICRQAGLNPGSKPTSVPQAKSVANALRKRLF